MVATKYVEIMFSVLCMKRFLVLYYFCIVQLEQQIEISVADSLPEDEAGVAESLQIFC